MSSSESKNEDLRGKIFNEKLSYIQVNLNAPKNMYNSFGKYNYRNLEGIFEGLKPLLAKTDLTVNVSDEIVIVGDRIYVKATASVTDGTSTATSFGWAREADSKKGMDSSQVTGATSSYARKYAMNGLFAIDDTVDADGMDNSNSKPKASKSSSSNQSDGWD